MFRNYHVPNTHKIKPILIVYIVLLLIPKFQLGKKYFSNEENVAILVNYGVKKMKDGNYRDQLHFLMWVNCSKIKTVLLNQ